MMSSTTSRDPDPICRHCMPMATRTAAAEELAGQAPDPGMRTRIACGQWGTGKTFVVFDLAAAS